MPISNEEWKQALARHQERERTGEIGAAEAARLLHGSYPGRSEGVTLETYQTELEALLAGRSRRAIYQAVKLILRAEAGGWGFSVSTLPSTQQVAEFVLEVDQLLQRPN